LRKLRQAIGRGDDLWFCDGQFAASVRSLAMRARSVRG
jgi:hypothetical protein